MSTITESAPGAVDLVALQVANPDSQAIPMIARAAEIEDWSDQTDRRGDWWGTVCDDYEQQRLTTAGVVGAYTAVMHPFGKGYAESDAVKQAEQLTAGTPVVGHDFNPLLSGRLVVDAVALLGHPDNRKRPKAYAGLRLGLQFDHRADIQEIYPGEDMTIGQAQISQAYHDRIASEHYNRPKPKQTLHDERLAEAAIIKRLGLVTGDETFQTAQDLLVNRLRMIKVNKLSADDTVALINTLPDVQVLDAALAQQYVRVLTSAPDDWVFKSYEAALITAVAQSYPCTDKSLDSVTRLEQDMARAKAAVHIYGIRLAGKDLG